MSALGPRLGEDRVAFLERRLTRRKAIQIGAAGTAAAVVSMYASPLVRTAHAQAVPGTGAVGYETAYALFSADSPDGGICFIPDLSSNWGWYHIRTASSFDEDWTLWRGAGQCDLDHGTNVGKVNVNRNGGNVTFTFDIATGYTLGLWHIYLKATAPSKIAPGQFGNQGSSSPVTLADPGGTIYIIVHAEIGELPLP